jgi:hypothetical protein
VHVAPVDPDVTLAEPVHAVARNDHRRLGVHSPGLYRIDGPRGGFWRSAILTDTLVRCGAFRKPI